MYFQVQGETLTPAAAFIEMAVGTAHKLLTNGNTFLPLLSNAVLPAPMTVSTTLSVMDCTIVQREGNTELVVQSSAVHFKASILLAPHGKEESSGLGRLLVVKVHIGLLKY